MIVKAVRAAHVASSKAFVGLGDVDRSHYGGRRNVGYALGREDRRHFLHFMGRFPFDGSQSRLWACGPRQRNDPGPTATGCLLSSGFLCGRYGDRRFSELADRSFMLLASPSFKGCCRYTISHLSFVSLIVSTVVWPCSA